MNFLTCSKSIKEMRRRHCGGENKPVVSLRIFAVKGKPFRVAGNRKKGPGSPGRIRLRFLYRLFAERAGEVVVLDPLDENLEVNRKRHGEKENLCLVRGELPKAGTESLGWKEYKGKERAAEELDALYKDGFDYVILPSMLSGTEKTGRQICWQEQLLL